jgi:ribosomal-protein-alanine N-acetyltransferase
MHKEIRPASQLPHRDVAPLPSCSNEHGSDGGGGARGCVGSGTVDGSARSHILRTRRLRLRHFTLDDAPFILSLLNDASWLRFIGDRNVHSLIDAQRYLKDGPFAMHAEHGHSLWAVTLADSDAAIGMCGLLKRACLRYADVGYAFLPHWRGQGFAREAAAATLQHARDALGMTKVVAVCSRDNDRSIRYPPPLPIVFPPTTSCTVQGCSKAWACAKKASCA